MLIMLAEYSIKYLCIMMKRIVELWEEDRSRTKEESSQWSTLRYADTIIPRGS